MGETATSIDIPNVCEALGAKVKVADPFEVMKTRETLFDLMEEDGVKVLVLKQACALSPDKKHTKAWEMAVDESICLGEGCGCNRFCTRVFACPGLVWDKEKGKAHIDEVVCTGCGVCAEICPVGAIGKEAVGA